MQEFDPGHGYVPESEKEEKPGLAKAFNTFINEGHKLKLRWFASFLMKIDEDHCLLYESDDYGNRYELDNQDITIGETKHTGLEVVAIKMEDPAYARYTWRDIERGVDWHCGYHFRHEQIESVYDVRSLAKYADPECHEGKPKEMDDVDRRILLNTMVSPNRIIKEVCLLISASKGPRVCDVLDYVEEHTDSREYVDLAWRLLECDRIATMKRNRITAQMLKKMGF